MEPQQPQQQPYIPPPNGQNPYDFIMNPQKPKHGGGLPSFGGAGSSPLKRGILIGGLIVVVLIVLVIVKAIIGGGDNLGLEFTPVLQQQQELIHLTSGSTNTNLAQLSTDNANAAATVYAVISSEQAEIQKYLATNKAKINSTAISATSSATTDQQLSSAAQSGTYNSAFVTVLKTELANYQASLQAAYLKVKGTHGRALLSKDFDQSKLLLQQFD
ncbi:MAG TPA: hypothetical protein VHB51_00015 [Candidatus Saccharimonadales bacterium]|nr:hypothetical protein [Candidatus Saccharimonadales bacterium]